jgi:hypothetical protein
MALRKKYLPNQPQAQAVIAPSPSAKSTPPTLSVPQVPAPAETPLETASTTNEDLEGSTGDIPEAGKASTSNPASGASTPSKVSRHLHTRLSADARRTPRTRKRRAKSKKIQACTCIPMMIMIQMLPVSH